MELAQVAQVVAPLRTAQRPRRIAGGSETDVYCTCDERHVLKIKPLVATTADAACTEICAMQEAATSFAAYLGREHSIATHFVLSVDAAGTYYAIGVQEYLAAARPLAAIDRQELIPSLRTQIEWQLLYFLRQALRCYHETGHMPDLYGTFSRNIVERKRMNSPLMWPRRIRQFLTQRLWSAHNLLLQEPLDDAVSPRVILVDYDQVRWRGWWGQLYYAVCFLLFWRDLFSLAGHRR